jgi:hypothetical protein
VGSVNGHVRDGLASMCRAPRSSRPERFCMRRSGPILGREMGAVLSRSRRRQVWADLAGMGRTEFGYEGEPAWTSHSM